MRTHLKPTEAEKKNTKHTQFNKSESLREHNNSSKNKICYHSYCLVFPMDFLFAVFILCGYIGKTCAKVEKRKYHFCAVFFSVFFLIYIRIHNAHSELQHILYCHQSKTHRKKCSCFCLWYGWMFFFFLCVVHICGKIFFSVFLMLTADIRKM